MTVKEVREFLEQFEDHQKLYQYNGKDWEPIKAGAMTMKDYHKDTKKIIII